VINISYGDEVEEEQNGGRESKGEGGEEPDQLEFYDEAHLAVAVCDTAIGTCSVLSLPHSDLTFILLNDCLLIFLHTVHVLKSGYVNESFKTFHSFGTEN
jgi:hypothetical protein